MEEMKDIHDITGQLPPDYQMLVLGSIFTLVVVLVIAYLIYRRLRPKQQPKPYVPPRKALAQLKTETISKLEALEATVREHEFKEYKNIFTRLSEIIREFLGEDLQIKALAMTKSELLALKAQSLDDILEISYGVVFATFEVDKNFTLQTISSAIEFVKTWNSGTRA